MTDEATSQATRVTAGDQGQPYISIPSNLPGVGGLTLFKPALGEKLQAFTQQLLRGPSPLSEAERELIAAYVSTGNQTTFCIRTHSATAAALLGENRQAVLSMIEDVDTAPISEKMRALLRIADKVRRSGLDVGPQDVEEARSAGAADEDIHDAVLVAAAFCMYNRYVDGLRAITPTDDAVYDVIAQRLAQTGYGVPKKRD